MLVYYGVKSEKCKITRFAILTFETQGQGLYFVFWQDGNDGLT